MIAKQKYNPDWDNQAYRLALLGMTDVEMAQYFGIGRATLARYKKQFPSFNEAMLNGKVEADAEVAKSLYKRAVGCTVTETKTKVVVDEDGNEQVTEVVKT